MKKIIYRVYFTNHEYFTDQEFGSILEALDYGRKTCFQFSIHSGPRGANPYRERFKMEYSWCPIGGLRQYAEYGVTHAL
jgi:hypothetical protein